MATPVAARTDELSQERDRIDTLYRITAELARTTYEAAVARLVARLRERDFELLVDLILARSGWVRLARLGGATEGVDVEVENVATGAMEIRGKTQSGERRTADGGRCMWKRVFSTLRLLTVRHPLLSAHASRGCRL